jgi:hypothetical protein
MAGWASMDVRHIGKLGMRIWIGNLGKEIYFKNKIF